MPINYALKSDGGGSVPTKPRTPTKTTQAINVQAVKIATSNLFVDQQTPTDAQSMTDLFFADIGGMELSSISRADLIGGKNVLYQPIKDLADIARVYNPQTLLGLQDKTNPIFANFSIDFNKHVPNLVYVEAQVPVYFKDDTQEFIVIDVINMLKNERVEVEFLTSGSINDTI